MRKPFQLTSSHRDVFDAWFTKATQDDGVWPYISFDRRTSISPPENDDWDRVYLMSDDRRALLRFTPDRANGMHDASVAIWSLSGPMKHLAAGAVLAELATLARRYGVRYLSAACHISNIDSRNILSKRFGPPWGRCPENGWNGKLGSFEDTLHFRKRVE